MKKEVWIGKVVIHDYFDKWVRDQLVTASSKKQWWFLAHRVREAEVAKGNSAKILNPSLSTGGQQRLF